MLLGHLWMERGVPSQANPPRIEGVHWELWEGLRLRAPKCHQRAHPRGVAAKGTVTSLPMVGPTAWSVLGHPKPQGWTLEDQSLDSRRSPSYHGATRPQKGAQGTASSGRTPRAFPSWEVGEQTEGPQGSVTRKGWGGVGLLGELWVWEGTTRSQHHWPQPSWHLQLQCLRCHILPRRKNFCPL